MMQDKENNIAKGLQPDQKAVNETPLSQTIDNANASGDGALERGKDSLLETEDRDMDDENSNAEKEPY